MSIALAYARRPAAHRRMRRPVAASTDLRHGTDLPCDRRTAQLTSTGSGAQPHAEPRVARRRGSPGPERAARWWSRCRGWSAPACASSRCETPPRAYPFGKPAFSISQAALDLRAAVALRPGRGRADGRRPAAANAAYSAALSTGFMKNDPTEYVSGSAASSTMPFTGTQTQYAVAGSRGIGRAHRRRRPARRRVRRSGSAPTGPTAVSRKSTDSTIHRSTCLKTLVR